MRTRIALLAALALVAGSAAQAQSRAVAGGAPWQAQIYSTFDGYSAEERAQKSDAELAHRCGGSLIADEWVLTAAHCITQAQIDEGYRIRLGVRDLDAGDGVTFRIDRMVRHAGYDPATHRNDIALVHLAADDQTDLEAGGQIEAVTLSDGAIALENAAVTATGWGKTSPGPDGRTSTILMQVDLMTVDCNSARSYIGLTDETMLCATAPGKDTCQGDSGGPLVLTYGDPVLVGIVSWGDGCADAAHPGVYIRVDQYRDWIDRAMAADPSVNAL